MDRDHINFIRQTQPGQKPPKKKRRGRRVFLYGAILILLLGLFFVGRAAFTPDQSLNPLDYDPVTLEPKKPEGLFKRLKHFVFSKDVQLAGERDDRVNILILGQGGPGHDGPFLTDTIIIGSIKPSTGQLSMISVPRDLGVEVPGYGWRKINSANAMGENKKSGWGAAFATEVIEDTFDIDIHYYVRIDFEAFEDVVDEVGGIRVNVARTFTDYEYPAPNDKYQVVSFEKGSQTMDGEEALIYARSRHGNNGEGSDFARAKRQQKVLLALKEKIFSARTLANPVRIHNIVQSLDKNITTNMTFPDIIEFVKQGREFSTEDIITVVLDNSIDGYLKNGYSPQGAFILSPKTGNFDEIKALFENVFDVETATKNDTPEQDVETIPQPTANIEVQNGTWRAGLAARVKKRLEDERFGVTTIGNTEERPLLESAIYILENTKDNTAAADGIKEVLGIPIRQTNTDFPYASSSDILVLLGEDYPQ